jgi:ribosome maturation factor RimP
LGYEIVCLELSQQQKILRLFIDHLEQSTGIGIEDCVKVTRALEEPLEKMSEVDQAFGGGTYELEVSSPGIDRPLRTERDFEKFKDREIRIHTFRPLTGDELQNAEYGTKNPKQKNFLGTLRGFTEGKVILTVNLTGGHDASVKRAKKAVEKTVAALKTGTNTNSAEAEAKNRVAIPLPLISKANLEPDFDELDRKSSSSTAPESELES